MANRGQIILICAGLVLATFIAYQPVFNNGFVGYDDDVYVTDNADIKNGFTTQSIFWAFTTSRATNWHPLTWLSHILDYRLFDLDPAGHHLTSLLLHITNTLLLFYVLRKMTSALWPSAFVACLFALHPLHVESVAWVSERKDVLSSMFWLLTMLAYAHYANRPSILRYSATLVLFSLGLMAKPMLVTLPFALLLLDYWPLNRPLDSRRSILKLLLEKVPFLVLSAACSAITYLVQEKTTMEVLPIGGRISNALISYISYIGKLFFPSGLNVFYPHTMGVTPAWKVVLAGLLLAVITVAAILAARKRRYLPVGWLWYLGTLVPVIGFVQVGEQSMADRYTYIPSIGIFIILAWSIAEILRRFRVSKIIPIASCVLIFVILIICTRTQITYWRDSETLFNRSLAVTKNNYKMEYALGHEFISQGRLDEAIARYRRALEIAPVIPEIRYDLANILRRQGKIDEAIEQYRLTIVYKKDYADAYNNLGFALLSQARFDEAEASFDETLKIKPDMVYALVGLAQVLAVKPNPDSNDTSMAVELAERAASLTGNKNATVLDTLAIAYAAAGRFDDALKAGQSALELASDENNSQLASAIAKRLDLYKIKKPYSIIKQSTDGD